jgi:Flp pilus assembly protein TadG
MKQRNHLIMKLRENSGVTAVIVALSIFALLGFGALAVDLGYVMVAKNELQNAADAAALAGAGELSSIYAAKTPPLTLNSGEQSQINTVASAIRLNNQAYGQDPNVVSSDIIIGYWDTNDNTFASAAPHDRVPNAVQVTARPSNGGTIGSVTTFFASIFGISNVAVAATSTASLTAPCSVPPDELACIAISFDSPFCEANPDIVFTGNSPPPCGAWTSLDQGANTNNLTDLLNTLLHDHGCTAHCGNNSSTNYSIPGKDIGDTTNVTNGLSNSLWQCFQDLYVCARDPITRIWTVSVPVVNKACGQMNQTPEIVGFATLSIKGVTVGSGSNVVSQGVPCGSSPCIKASVVCDNVIDDTRGGGCTYFGSYGSIPGLVK